MKAGVEPEYMLISQDGQTISDEKDIASKPSLRCFDQTTTCKLVSPVYI